MYIYLYACCKCILIYVSYVSYTSYYIRQSLYVSTYTARARVYIILYCCCCCIHKFVWICVCVRMLHSVTLCWCVYMFEWRHFNSEWDFLSFIYVPIESVDFISCRTSVPTLSLAVSPPLIHSLTPSLPHFLPFSLLFCVCVCCHEEHENRETCALGSVGAVMCKAR